MQSLTVHEVAQSANPSTGQYVVIVPASEGQESSPSYPFARYREALGFCETLGYKPEESIYRKVCSVDEGELMDEGDDWMAGRRASKSVK